MAKKDKVVNLENPILELLYFAGIKLTVQKPCATVAPLDSPDTRHDCSATYKQWSSLHISSHKFVAELCKMLND